MKTEEYNEFCREVFRLGFPSKVVINKPLADEILSMEREAGREPYSCRNDQFWSVIRPNGEFLIPKYDWGFDASHYVIATREIDNAKD